MVVVFNDSLVVENQTVSCTTEMYNDDICPLQFDGVCQETTDYRCNGGDCYDCDPAHSYHYDCSACIGHGFLWCPGK